MNTLAAATHRPEPETYQEQFDFMRKKVSALLEIFIENLPQQDNATQNKISADIIELESYVETLFRRFSIGRVPAPPNLDNEMEWIDMRALAIIETLEKGRRNAR
jgi:hypothetical protein